MRTVLESGDELCAYSVVAFLEQFDDVVGRDSDKVAVC